MAATENTRAGDGGPRHGRRIFTIWLVLTVAVDLVIWFVWGPHMPPGDMSSSAQSQQLDYKVLAVVAAPVMLLIYVYFAYALTVWRQRDGDEEDGPGELPGAGRIQKTWISVTSLLVIGLFAFGTVQLVVPAGAGAGEGPKAAWKISGKPLQVQVIAQQWRFLYRYPSLGGMETKELVLPVDQPIQFNVTSLDVIHSFWAIQLGVKADAVPNANNIAYTKPLHTGHFMVRCAELCGLWHGAMFNGARVVSDSAFTTWAQKTETRLAAATKLLPKYALTYSPTEQGAGGGLYGPNFPAQP